MSTRRCSLCCGQVKLVIIDVHAYAVVEGSCVVKQWCTDMQLLHYLLHLDPYSTGSFGDDVGWDAVGGGAEV
jgi:hypothetical protein